MSRSYPLLSRRLYTFLLETVLISALLFLPGRFSGLYAQTKSIYSFQDLSHLYYARQKDSLKKAWICPAVYKNKETQQKYKEIWDDRTDFLLKAIANDNYLHDQEVYPYIEQIIDQIVAANRDIIPVRPFLLLDRSASVNAYSLGGNIIAVNLGLISFVRSREELAMAIAHEMSHNLLQHPENAMRQRAEWLSSDEYRNSLNAVLDSKYERLSRLKKVLEGYSFSRSRHQRYHENEADSLAILLLKKSQLAFEAGFFLRLDSSDNQYKLPLRSPIRNYFTSYHLSFDDAWTQKRTRGLSTRNYHFADTTNLEDSLKTHPDCEERYNRTKGLSAAGAPLTPLPVSVLDKSDKMLIWNLYYNMSLTACLYRVLQEKDRGNTDAWYDFMINNIFAGLYYSDKGLHRFNAIGVTPKEYISRDYYELQNMLEQIPRDNLEQYCKSFQDEGFWKNMEPAEKAFKSLLFTLSMDPDQSEKNKSRAAKEFISNNASSMYCEIADIFQKP